MLPYRNIEKTKPETKKKWFRSFKLKRKVELLRKDEKTTSEIRLDKEYIDRAACFLDVGSSYPGHAEVAKGRAVRPLKGNVSWV